MTKKELQQYEKMKAELKRLEDKISELETNLYNASPPVISDMPKNAGLSDFSDKVIKLADLKKTYSSQWDKLIDKRIKIENAINALEDSTERALMGYKYIDGYTWEEVCVKINYSYRHTTRLHGEILNKMRRI